MLGRLFSFFVVSFLLLAGTAQAQGKAELLWYSQAAFKLTTQSGKVILIDPWIMGATKIPPELKNLDAAIGKPDLILVTHGHDDHVGDAVLAARESGAPVIAPRRWSRLGLSNAW